MSLEHSDNGDKNAQAKNQSPNNIDLVSLSRPDTLSKAAESMGKAAAGDNSNKSEHSKDSSKNESAASALADSIIKNSGFGKGEDRSTASSTLLNQVEESLKKGNNEDQKFVKDVNEQLAKKGSTLHLDERGGGGGGRSGGTDNDYQLHAEASGRFTITDDKGGQKDGMNFAAAVDTHIKNGKIVGEREVSQGDSGGGGGGRGEMLHDVTIQGLDLDHLGKGGGGGGGGGKGGHGGGGGGGGSKGGSSPMRDTTGG